jgi:hypothetical protein
MREAAEISWMAYLQMCRIGRGRHVEAGGQADAAVGRQ